MRVVALVGSNRRNGNTRRVATALLEEMSRQAAAPEVRGGVSSVGNARLAGGVETELVLIGREDVRFCRGCRACFDRGEQFCPNKDAVLPIKEKLRAADCVIFASPVYVDDVSGIMKNWIDRMAHVCHRPEFAGKSAFVLATTGGSPSRHAVRTLVVPLLTWGFTLLGRAGLAMGAHSSDEEIARVFMPRIRRIARTIVHSLSTQYPPKPSFFSLMTFKIQQWSWQRARQSGVDREYWVSRNWFDPSTRYYVPFRAFGAKVLAARLAGAVIGRFMVRKEGRA